MTTGTLIKINVVLTAATVGLALSMAGLIVTGTLGYSDITHRLDNDHGELVGVHEDIKSIDGRLNTGTTEQTTLDKRVSLLEQQFIWTTTRKR